MRYTFALTERRQIFNDARQLHDDEGLKSLGGIRTVMISAYGRDESDARLAARFQYSRKWRDGIITIDRIAHTN